MTMAQLPKLDNSNLVDKTYSILKDMIIKRKFPPNHKLSIPDVSSQLGVSRTPVREALNLLEKDGLVKTVSKVGTFVTAITADDVLEIMDTRLMIELWVVDKVAQKTASSLAPVISSLEKIHELSTFVVESSSIEAYHEGDYNLMFHMDFVQLGDNKKMAEVYRNMMNYRFLAMKTHLINKEMVMRSLGHHRQMIDALKSGSHADLKRVVSEHLEEAKIRLYQNINVNGGVI
jgi:DNA-binding GntR family transcriptional regulator